MVSRVQRSRPFGLGSIDQSRLPQRLQGGGFEAETVAVFSGSLN
jgi:hypothetical protein